MIISYVREYNRSTMGKMGHVVGKNISKRHSTVIEAALPIVTFLQKTGEISNIGLGRLDVHLPPTEWRIKMSEMRGGLLLQIRGTNSIQQIRVYTAAVEIVRTKLLEEFGRKYLFVG